MTLMLKKITEKLLDASSTNPFTSLTFKSLKNHTLKRQGPKHYFIPNFRVTTKANIFETLNLKLKYIPYTDI